MKINLIRKDSEKIEGFVNIDPHPSSPNVIAGEHQNLDSLVDDGECDEVRAYDVIDFIPSNKLVPTLINWIKKLSIKGKLIVGGSDIQEIARGLYQGNLNDVLANEMLFNANDTSWDIKTNSYKMETICDVIEKLGLKIENKVLKNYRYVIVGVR